jgi:hypothetical protein
MVGFKNPLPTLQKTLFHAKVFARKNFFSVPKLLREIQMRGMVGFKNPLPTLH